MLVHIKPKNSTNIQHDKVDKLLKLDYLKTTILQIAHSCMAGPLTSKLITLSLWDKGVRVLARPSLLGRVEPPPPLWVMGVNGQTFSLSFWNSIIIAGVRARTMTQPSLFYNTPLGIVRLLKITLNSSNLIIVPLHAIKPPNTASPLTADHFKSKVGFLGLNVGPHYLLFYQYWWAGLFPTNTRL